MAPANFSTNGGRVKSSLLGVERLFLAFILAMLLASCASQPPTAPAPASTPKPVSTSSVLPQRAAPAPEFIGLSSGGFTVAIQPGLEFEAHADSISISDRQGELVVSLNGRPYAASSYTIRSFLGKYLTEMASRGGAFEQGEPYEILIDGRSGIAVDFSGSFLDNPVSGKAVAVSPAEDFIVFGLGMSLLNEHENGWAESGSLVFESILDSIDFKDEFR